MAAEEEAMASHLADFNVQLQSRQRRSSEQKYLVMKSQRINRGFVLLKQWMSEPKLGNPLNSSWAVSVRDFAAAANVTKPVYGEAHG